jgi:hypothetical protein
MSNMIDTHNLTFLPFCECWRPYAIHKDAYEYPCSLHEGRIHKIPAREMALHHPIYDEARRLGDEERERAQGIDARRAETVGLGPKDESPVAATSGDAP